jgi:hypothetical protein
MKNLNQNRWSLGRHFNAGPAEYAAGVLNSLQHKNIRLMILRCVTMTDNYFNIDLHDVSAVGSSSDSLAL